MANIYHVLTQPPIVQGDSLAIEMEALANRLVLSGRLRIDADDRVNFVKYDSPYEDVYMVFSRRDLFDPALVVRTEERLTDTLASHYAEEELRHTVKATLEHLRRQINKHLEVDREMERQIARLLVQSTHPAVMSLLLWEQVEVFVSFSHNIGDMLDVYSWQILGRNSGMQSTGSNDYAVYVSCGGNPFVAEENKAHEYEGFHAKARLMVIAAQELGHYADVIRDAQGRPCGRHSADMGGRRATQVARIARLKDIEMVQAVVARLQHYGMDEAAKTEKALHFYEEHRPKDAICRKTRRQLKKLNRRLVKQAKSAGMDWIEVFGSHSAKTDEGFARQLAMMCQDMAFNLTPVADAYKRDDPVEEEAVACIEALARVPQQAVKWGHPLTRALWPNLHSFYYNTVIPDILRSHEELTGHPFQMTLTWPKKPWWSKIWPF